MTELAYLREEREDLIAVYMVMKMETTETDEL